VLKKRLSGEKGFTLLEVLLAVAVLGLAVAGTWRLAGLEARTQDQVGQRQALLCQSRDLMETWLSEPHPVPGVYQGQGGGVRWEVRVERRPAARSQAQEQEPPPSLLWVQVCSRPAQGPGQAQVCLSSARLEPREMARP
jgi:prepilin-type N-terminal cleavage/methylation domain-containing protein